MKLASESAIEQTLLKMASLKMSIAQVEVAWLMLKYGWHPDQPRVPAGSGRESGRWSDDGTVVANNTRGPRGPRGGLSEATPAQQARFAAANARAEALSAQVRQRDPNWRPEPGLYEGAEGAIANEIAIARQAEARLQNLARPAIIEPKIAKAMPARGWTIDSINQTISNPARMMPSRDTRFDEVSGRRLDEPATAYIARDGSYVIKNDRNGRIVQISDKYDLEWKAPWDKKRHRCPWRVSPCGNWVCRQSGGRVWRCLITPAASDFWTIVKRTKSVVLARMDLSWTSNTYIHKWIILRIFRHHSNAT